jgi:hypothetical protein
LKIPGNATREVGDDKGKGCVCEIFMGKCRLLSKATRLPPIHTTYFVLLLAATLVVAAITTAAPINYARTYYEPLLSLPAVDC